MFSKQEASQLRQEFWTVFGQYMRPVLSAEGEKVNWINYKTGIKGIQFRMDADNKMATIGIVIQPKEEGIGELYFEQFTELKKLLEEALGESWTWQPDQYDESGRHFRRIFTSREALSIFRREDWPQLISFFKPRILALDQFWTDARYSFEALQ
jgi:hypothetical protein